MLHKFEKSTAVPLKIRKNYFNSRIKIFIFYLVSYRETSGLCINLFSDFHKHSYQKSAKTIHLQHQALAITYYLFEITLLFIPWLDTDDFLTGFIYLFHLLGRIFQTKQLSSDYQCFKRRLNRVYITYKYFLTFDFVLAEKLDGAPGCSMSSG